MGGHREGIGTADDEARVPIPCAVHHQIMEASPTTVSQYQLHKIYHRGLLANLRPSKLPTAYGRLISIRDAAIRLER